MQLKTAGQPFYWWPTRIYAGRAGVEDRDWYLWLWFKWWAVR
jgi:hypothetical protein